MIQQSLTQSRRGTKGGVDRGPAVLRGFVPSCESGPFSITGSGTHTIRWKYIKGGSGSSGSDCLWIDNVRWSGAMPDVNEIEYVYDLSGRRIEKKRNGVTQLKFLYDGDHILAEYDANDTLLRKYVHGPCIDEPICMIESSGTYAGTQYYHYDALGSVVALTDPNGDVVQLYEYSVYGQVAASDANHPNRFMFTGREFDKDTGLYYYRARYYNPEIGRFLQTDPIGYDDGMNCYAYCANNPVIMTDPSGKMKWSSPPDTLCMAGYTIGIASSSPTNNTGGDSSSVSYVSRSVQIKWTPDPDVCWIPWHGTNQATVTLKAPISNGNFLGTVDATFTSDTLAGFGDVHAENRLMWSYSEAHVVGFEDRGPGKRVIRMVFEITWSQPSIPFGLLPDWVPWPWTNYMKVFGQIWVCEDGTSGYSITPSSDVWDYHWAGQPCLGGGWNLEIDGRQVRPPKKGEEKGGTITNR